MAIIATHSDFFSTLFGLRREKREVNEWYNVHGDHIAAAATDLDLDWNGFTGNHTAGYANVDLIETYPTRGQAGVLQFCQRAAD